MSRERLEDLLVLDPSKFERREYTALSWVEAFLTRPEGVPDEIEDEFERCFTEEERVNIAAAMKAMFCVNLTVSTGRRLLERLLRNSRRSRYGTCGRE